MGENKTVVERKDKRNMHKADRDFMVFQRKKKSASSHMGKMLRAVLESAGLVNGGGSKNM